MPGRHTPRAGRPPRRLVLAMLGMIAGAIAIATPVAQAVDSAPLPPDVDPTTVDVTVTDGASVRVVNATLALSTTVTPTVVTPGSTIRYAYTVTARGGAFGNIRVTDDKCEPVTGPTGDGNADRILQPGETWVYGCSTTVSKDQTNAARVTGRYVLDTTTVTPSPTPSSSPSPSSSPAGLKDGTYTGATVNVTGGDCPSNLCGTLGTTMTVTGGRITAVSIPVLTYTETTSRLYAQPAVPDLITAAIAAQSANVGVIGGASYTSAAFTKSLQAALLAAAV